MRLIDADTLWEELGIMYHQNNGKVTWNDALMEIKTAPTIETDEDTVSRKAALDALDKRFDSIPMEQTTEILLLRKDLRELPSAQPEKRTEERTETHACDLISRQAALEAVDKNRDTVFCNSVDYEGVLYDISNLPSAQPEIVRCKDCKHWSRESICDGFCSEDCMRHDEDFYYGYAERRTDETD